MAKSKSEYVCQNCGVKSPKWIGRCPACQEWNTYVEEVIQREDKRSFKPEGKKAVPVKITEVTAKKEKRIDSKISEFNRILGGGIISGSTILIGGEPGIGKSTLALQLALHLSDLNVLYISGEESSEQIKLRAERIGTLHEQCYLLS